MLSVSGMEHEELEDQIQEIDCDAELRRQLIMHLGRHRVAHVSIERVTIDGVNEDVYIDISLHPGQEGSASEYNSLVPVIQDKIGTMDLPLGSPQHDLIKGTRYPYHFKVGLLQPFGPVYGTGVALAHV